MRSAVECHRQETGTEQRNGEREDGAERDRESGAVKAREGR